MTPTQRAAAERLAFEQWYDAQPDGRISPWDVWQAAALLRELLAEPVQEPVAYIDQRQLAAGYVTLLCITRPEYRSYADVAEGIHYTPVYLHPAQQRKPLTPSMQAEVECDCLVAWNASTYGHSAQDTVHPMFLSAFISGYRAAERAHGITGEPT
jgi:hypothetical protein